MRVRVLISALFAAAAAAAPALAEPTPLTVRVLAKDAKFVGEGMGGVRVLVRDAETGALLAEGVTSGVTGDTDKLVRQPKVRGAALAGPGDARFDAVLDLKAPRRITVEAYGPLAQLQSAVTVSQTQWVLPGRRPHGADGWVLELPGLAVDVVDPVAYARGVRPGDVVPITANVVLMCGCDVTPGGVWNADEYEIGYTVVRDGATVAEGPMAYAGRQSRFQAAFTPDRGGVYQVLVSAYHPVTGNAGIDRATVIVP
jgi:hypothetical protein